MKNIEKWAYSLDEEEGWQPVKDELEARYEGNLEAIDQGQDHFFISEIEYFEVVMPTAEQIIDIITDETLNQDGVPECADGWLLDASNKVKLDLEKQVRGAINSWLDKHKLNPNWFMCNKVMCIETEDIIK